MKICGCVAEYNPLHSGHLSHLNYVKNVLKAENTIVLMSGNFTQRGEAAVFDKYTRARHAILAGADMVIELPAVFATATAEIFAKGAIKIFNSLGVIDGICFGAENAEKQDYLNLASSLNDESKEFKKILRGYLDEGESLVRAKFMTVKKLHGGKMQEDLISYPNNILGVEYVKAILASKSKMDFFPMKRETGHNDTELKKDYASASALRLAVADGKIKATKKYLPKYVYADINLAADVKNFDLMTMAALIVTPAEELNGVCDCTEGLENRIKALSKDNLSMDALTDKVCTKRYTKARVRRILTANLLSIKKTFIDECLENDLYVKVLALNKNRKDLLSTVAENCTVPVITRKSDGINLKKTALKCFEKDVLTGDIYGLATGRKQNENGMILV